MHFITDTHSLVWYFTDDSRLGKKALETFEQTTKEGLILVPTLVLAEIMYIARKGRIPITFSETIKRIEGYDNYDIVPLDTDILKIADTLDVGMEMHDKLLVATTLYFHATLITKDDQINEARICSTIW